MKKIIFTQEEFFNIIVDLFKPNFSTKSCTYDYNKINFVKDFLFIIDNDNFVKKNDLIISFNYDFFEEDFDIFYQDPNFNLDHTEGYFSPEAESFQDKLEEFRIKYSSNRYLLDFIFDIKKYEIIKEKFKIENLIINKKNSNTKIINKI